MKQATDRRGQPDEGEKGKVRMAYQNWERLDPKIRKVGFGWVCSVHCRLLDKQRKKEEADAARRAAEERMKAPQLSCLGV